MSENYSEAERRLIESRNQTATNQVAVPFSVDQPTTPRIDKKPEAKDVDLKSMVAKVNEASKEQQANAPTVFDTIDKDMPWLKWVGGGLGLLGAGYLAHRFLGGDDNIPPDNNNPPNNRTKSPKDRSFTRTEPTFNSAEATQASMTAGEPKFVADPIPVAPKPVTDVVTVPGTPDTTASVIPTTDQPKVVPVPSEARPPMQYGETKYNVPTASPEVAIAPPASVEPVAVAPKPIDPVQQAKLDSIAAAERRKEEAHAADQQRKDEVHANRISKDAQKAEASTQQKQGQVKSNLSKQDQSILADNAEAKARADVVASGQPKPKTASPIGGTSIPVEGAATPPAGTPPVKVEVPEGRIPAYPNPKRNKQGKDVIGQGGWHWYQGQMGPEAEKNWLNQFGRTNQSYADVKQAVKEGRLQGAVVNAEGHGGSFEREKSVPNYIKGSASIEGMTRSGLAALGLLPVAEEIKKGNYKNALNEAIPALAMASPALSLAASPLYLSSEEKDALQSMRNKGFKSFKELEKYKEAVGAGRGIAPPSMR